jgi:hypothetical protein
MSDHTKTLEELVREVPLECRAELRGYVESLLARHSVEQPGKPQFAWAGALEALRDVYTSVDLQHQIARWRIERE